MILQQFKFYRTIETYLVNQELRDGWRIVEYKPAYKLQYGDNGVWILFEKEVSE